MNMKKIFALMILALVMVACDNQDSATGPKEYTLDFSGQKSGENFTLAINSDGSVWGWGSNNWGVLGHNEDTYISSELPTKISGLDDITELATGLHHAVALNDKGILYTWGANDAGQLGLGSVYKYNYSPSKVNIKEKVQYISTGADFNIAVTETGKVYSWGNNAYNCQGHEQLMICHTPVLSLFMTNLTKIVINGYSCIAMDNKGNVWTWGNNTNNRLGREYEPFSGDGLRPAINGQLGKATDIGYDRNFYVIDGNGKRTDITGQGEPAI